MRGELEENSEEISSVALLSPACLQISFGDECGSCGVCLYEGGCSADEKLTCIQTVNRS